MAGYLYPMPVVVIRYFPTEDGVTVDAADRRATRVPLAGIRAYTNTLNHRVKFMLEEGSRYRGYADATALPSLGYRIVAMITVYEEMPRGKDVGEGHYYPDYNQILERFDAEHYVNDLGVKEFWLWGYHNGPIVPAESNMASPTTGDISNSYRFPDDMPVYDHTYVLYNYNFTRSQAEAVHNHGHQLEAILSYVNQRQAGNTELFWRRFVGQDANGQFVTGRCGWTHMPPNTTDDYDYLNPALVASDIADWRPDGGGATTLVNLNTWGNVAVRLAGESGEHPAAHRIPVVHLLVAVDAGARQRASPTSISRSPTGGTSPPTGTKRRTSNVGLWGGLVATPDTPSWRPSRSFCRRVPTRSTRAR